MESERRMLMPELSQGSGYFPWNLLSASSKSIIKTGKVNFNSLNNNF